MLTKIDLVHSELFSFQFENDKKAFEDKIAAENAALQKAALIKYHNFLLEYLTEQLLLLIEDVNECQKYLEKKCHEITANVVKFLENESTDITPSYKTFRYAYELPPFMQRAFGLEKNSKQPDPGIKSSIKAGYEKHALFTDITKKMSSVAQKPFILSDNTTTNITNMLVRLSQIEKLRNEVKTELKSKSEILHKDCTHLDTNFFKAIFNGFIDLFLNRRKTSEKIAEKLSQRQTNLFSKNINNKQNENEQDVFVKKPTK